MLKKTEQLFWVQKNHSVAMKVSETTGICLTYFSNNRVKKISSEPDAFVKRATSGSQAIGSRRLH